MIDGKTYHSVDEMPPEVRNKYETAMRSPGDANNNRIPDAFENANIFADKDKNGIPDFVEGMIETTSSSTSFTVETPGGTTSLPTSSTITPDTSNGMMLALAGLLLFLLCVVATGAVWYFFMR